MFSLSAPSNAFFNFKEKLWKNYAWVSKFLVPRWIYLSIFPELSEVPLSKPPNLTFPFEWLVIDFSHISMCCTRKWTLAFSTIDLSSANLITSPYHWTWEDWRIIFTLPPYLLVEILEVWLRVVCSCRLDSHLLSLGSRMTYIQKQFVWNVYLEVFQNMHIEWSWIPHLTFATTYPRVCPLCPLLGW